MNPCDTCPFNDGLTEEATIAQNYGCLPDGGMILDGYDKRGKVWMCHSNEGRICNGLRNNRPNPEGTPVKYSEWYHGKSDL